ncbi:MAG: thiol-disulfide oxidoreductase DCC family protein [Deltaproteobacteria bacterium]|nr:thiol-disulfide oxidoreductase DCC family protein [Deltaproteobacteria bacterium]
MSAAPVLYFDGVCNLCATSVHFVLEHERDATLRFASLQSAQAQQVLPGLGIDPADLDSLVLVRDGVAYSRSSGALETARYLKSPWSWATVFLWIPKPIRDFMYKIVARNRYRFWGKKDECMIPTPQLKARFL